jgi:hypothetical protein
VVASGGGGVAAGGGAVVSNKVCEIVIFLWVFVNQLVKSSDPIFVSQINVEVAGNGLEIRRKIKLINQRN